MRRFIVLTLSFIASGLIASCVKGSLGTQGTSICDPGEQIFCRCPGGEAGTKTCNQDGQSFASCATASGACPIVSDESGSSTASGGLSSVSGGTGWRGLPLYYPCMQDTDCASGECPMGFCSQPCDVAKDCGIGYGVCVSYEGSPTCLAGCRLQSECKTLYGGVSQCGYAKAVDGKPTAACANWGNTLELPPLGLACKDNIDCSLGHLGVQEVCALQKCTKGCYTQDDCPINTTCLGKGGLLGPCK